MGGNKGIQFKLHCQFELDAEEHALVEKAKVGEWILATYADTCCGTIGIIMNDSMIDTLKRSLKDLETEEIGINWTVNDLVHGKSISRTDILLLIQLEYDIKVGCQSLKTLLQSMSSFGGEAAIEI